MLTTEQDMNTHVCGSAGADVCVQFCVSLLSLLSIACLVGICSSAFVRKNTGSRGFSEGTKHSDTDDQGSGL